MSRPLMAALIPVLVATAAGTVLAAPDPVENSVVKVFCTIRQPDLYRPWTKQQPGEATGTGVVIEGKRILSNAHVVQYASQVQIQASQDGNKFSATVEAVAPGIDLAVLKLDDEKFFDTHPPLPRSTQLPEVRDAVMAYGYPLGGATLSITKGIVSRIEFTGYNYTTSGLRIQVDAAINPGNSGGPAVVGEKMIGLAFSHLSGGENISYIIPCEEVELFLKDVADGKYDGKPAMFDVLQTMENPALQSFLKLPKNVEGVVVQKPASKAADYPLKEWDVITRIGDAAIDDEGMVKIKSDLRVGFTYLIQRLAKNGKVTLTVLREGKELAIELPVPTSRKLAIPSLIGTYPSYFICGPLAFSTATTELLDNVSSQGAGRWLTALVAKGSQLVKRVGDSPAFPGEELVVVSSPFFPHKLAKGYSSPVLQVVKSINGKPIKNIAHLVEVLRDAREDFITIEFDGRGSERLVFPRRDMIAATEEILTDNGVRNQGSPDTLAIWNAKPSQ